MKAEPFQINLSLAADMTHIETVVKGFKPQDGIWDLTMLKCVHPPPFMGGSVQMTMAIYWPRDDSEKWKNA